MMGVKTGGIRTDDARALTKWKGRALRAIFTLAQGGSFTADDVWWQLGPKDQLRSPSVLGPVFQWAQREGMVRPTGRYVPTELPRRRHRRVQVWEPA